MDADRCKILNSGAPLGLEVASATCNPANPSKILRSHSTVIFRAGSPNPTSHSHKGFEAVYSQLPRHKSAFLAVPAGIINKQHSSSRPAWNIMPSCLACPDLDLKCYVCLFVCFTVFR